MKTPTDVVMFSGGAGSWAAAKRIALEKGTDGLVLLFADTLAEDSDLYRFIGEAADNIGAPLITITEGRTPWQVMSDERIIGNTRIDPCSKILKRQFMDKWRDANCNANETTIYLGIDWSEEHRLKGVQERTKPWRYEAPLCAPPYLTKADILADMKGQGLKPPRLYFQGFQHNNCGGACIKAGQAQWELLFRVNPNLYLEKERWEQDMRAEIGDHAILRDRRGGKVRPLTLREFRENIEAGNLELFDRFDWGGCGCAL